MSKKIKSMEHEYAQNNCISRKNGTKLITSISMAFQKKEAYKVGVSIGLCFPPLEGLKARIRAGATFFPVDSHLWVVKLVSFQASILPLNSNLMISGQH